MSSVSIDILTEEYVDHLELPQSGSTMPFPYEGGRVMHTLQYIFHEHNVYKHTEAHISKKLSIF